MAGQQQVLHQLLGDGRAALGDAALGGVLPHGLGRWPAGRRRGGGRSARPRWRRRPARGGRGSRPGEMLARFSSACSVTIGVPSAARMVEDWAEAGSSASSSRSSQLQRRRTQGDDEQQPSLAHIGRHRRTRVVPPSQHGRPRRPRRSWPDPRHDRPGGPRRPAGRGADDRLLRLRPDRRQPAHRQPHRPDGAAAAGRGRPPGRAAGRRRPPGWSATSAGRSEERNLLDEDTLRSNVASIKDQIAGVLGDPRVRRWSTTTRWTAT